MKQRCACLEWFDRREEKHARLPLLAIFICSWWYFLFVRFVKNFFGDEDLCRWVVQ